MKVHTQTGEVHKCQPPVKGGSTFPLAEPIGRRGDVWRCDCGDLWTLGYRCDVCQAAGGWKMRHHGGQHWVGLMWRPSGWWDRWRFRKAGRRRQQYGVDPVRAPRADFITPEPDEWHG